jgi:mannitol/fructose-specific phosphotransferase system IIA component (Ntr-type)
MAFGLALMLAGFFEYMGLAMIIGAYVMGVALSRTDLKHSICEMLTPVYTFLVPVFFCVMGMMVDVNALCSKPVLVFGGIYTVLAIGAKIFGCLVPSLCCGFNVLGGLRIGAGMVPRGEVALIIAGLGLSYGYLTQEIFGIGILMTLVTTVIAPPALVVLFSSRRRGVRRVKKTKDDSRTVMFELANREAADLMMTKLIEEFRKEGFFTTCLSQADQIWEVAVDDIELSLSCRNAKIRFTCTPAEEAIVMTAWMEVASQMNDLARSLAKPIRREDFDKQFAASEAANHGHEGVSRHLGDFLMLPGFSAASKLEAITKLVDEIAKAHPESIKNREEAVAAVLKREESMPTGLDRGIAVPHGRSPTVSGIVGAVAILDDKGRSGGCLPDYETIDNSPVQIIVLTLANDTEQTPYLKLMSFISRALRAEDGVEKLVLCKTPDEMRRFFRRAK